MNVVKLNRIKIITNFEEFITEHFVTIQISPLRLQLGPIIWIKMLHQKSIKMLDPDCQFFVQSLYIMGVSAILQQ